MAEDKKIGKILLEEGMITEEQLAQALEKQVKTSEALGFILVGFNFITEDVLYHFLAMQENLRFVDVTTISLEEEVTKIINRKTALKYNIIPIEKKPGKIVFATSDLLNSALKANLKYELGLEAEYDFAFVGTTVSALLSAIDKYYALPTGPGLDEAIDAAGGEDYSIEIIEDKIKKDDEMEEGDIAGDNSPVVKYVNYMIENAVVKRASDIHINPYEKKIVLRYRVDGSLVEMPPPKIQFKKPLTSRIKLLSGMNIIEKRMPQDGRMKFVLSNGKTIDLRVAVVPSIWGENIVMRIINQEAQSLDMADLGLFPEQIAGIEKGLARPYGMVLVTGPTGCGKTTTVYSCLKKINNPQDNIMTVEDPVEYRLPHVIQVQVNPLADLTFANVLRSFLRQDPDIMLVGEIRDDETASIAVKAALTGHLVLSTLHTNDAPTTIARLVDMGIDEIYVGSSVLVASSQRLIRRICPNCKEKLKVTDYAKAKKGGIPSELIEGVEYYEGRGCPNCNYTGYRGRLAVFEVLPVNMQIREAIFKKATLNALKRVSWEIGMRTIRESGIEQMKAGLTTLDEVLRETLHDKPLAEYMKKGIKFA